VEQIRRKQQQPNRNDGGGGGGLQRRMNAFKHNPPAMLLKDAMAVTFGAGKYQRHINFNYYDSTERLAQVWLQNNVIPAGACNNVNNVVTAATATAANKLMPGCANSVASIQVQPMLPGRPSSAFDFTALGLMAKIIGTMKWYFDVFQMTGNVIVCYIESPPLVTLQVAGKSPSASLACLQPLQDGLQAMARQHSSSPSVTQVTTMLDAADVEANDVKIKNGNHLAADAEMTSISEAGKDLLIDQLAAAPPAPSFSWEHLNAGMWGTGLAQHASSLFSSFSFYNPYVPITATPID
jgi:hypothetical protein